MIIANGIRELTATDKEKNAPYHVGNFIDLNLDRANAYFKANKKPQYPNGWKIINQAEIEFGNDQCGGAASSFVLSLLNNYPVGMHFVWMMARQFGGEELDSFGVSNRDLADSIRKIGALRQEEEPFTLQDGRDKIANPANWDLIKYVPLAKKQISGGQLWIEPRNGMDSFDVFKCSIAEFNIKYKKQHGAVFGMKWNYPVSQKYLDEPVTEGGGHDVACYWVDGEYIVTVQSMGTQAGENGEIYIHRKVFNAWAERYGCFIPIDATEEQIKQALASGSKLPQPASSNVARMIMEKLLKLWKKLLLIVKEQPQTGAIPSKLLLQALCWQESDVSLDAVGDKHLKNWAYGILQIRQPYMTDVYKWRNAKECINNLPLSLDVFNKYMARYATEKRLGRPVTDQDIARMHNGGPAGYKNPNTLLYWYQVRNKMQRLENGTAPQYIVDRLKANNLL